MASLARVGLTRLLFRSGPKLNSLRCITSKVIRDQDPNRPKKPAPWNYEEKSYTILNYYIDRTTSRLDENSKVVFD